VLVFVIVGSGWLEIMLRTRVLRRWKRLLLSISFQFDVVIWMQK
jgi:hypothetical protein